MKEIWKDIEGYEGKYQVSNQGRIKSLNYNHTGQERALNLILDTGGYLKVNLYKGGKRKKYKVHRLVAEAFIPNPVGKPYIDHINTIRTDNRIDNLRWVTQKENCNNQITKEHNKISSIGKNTGNQNRAKKVFCENTIYDSIKQCAIHYNVGIRTMGRWLAGIYKMPADFQAKGLRYCIEE